MDTSISKPELETELGYKQLFTILLRRRFIFGSVFLVVVFLSAAATLIMTPVFKSKMQLLVEPNYKDRAELGSGERANLSKFNQEVDYATQLTLLRSTEFLDKAVEELRSKYPNIELRDIQASFSLIQVEQDGVNTRIYQGTFTNSNPQKTRDVLQAIQQVYQDYDREQANLRLNEGLASIQREIDLVSDNLSQAQTALREFRENYSIINPQDRGTELTRTLNSITQERLANRAQFRDIQARYSQIQRKLGITSRDAEVYSRLSGSPSYQALLQELKATETELAQERRRFTDTNPVVQNLLTKRQSIIAGMQDQMRRVAGPGYNSQQDISSTGELGNNQIRQFIEFIDARTELQGLLARQGALLENEQRVLQEINRISGIIGEYNSLEQEVEIQEQSLARLLEQEQQLSLELSRGGFKWQIVEAPQLGEKVAPSLRTNLAMGIVVGLFLGGVSAFIRESLDDTIHSYPELRQKTSLRLLGAIPNLSQIGGVSLREILDRTQFRESLDLIYKNIRLVTSAGGIRSLLVTSAKAGEGKSTIALGLAVSAARQHQRVLIIDSDLRYPSLHKQLKLPNEYGLSTYLSNNSLLPKLQEISLSGSKIEVLTAGPNPKDPVSLLSSQTMKELIDNCKNDYDLVILDCPPILGVADTLEIGSFCDGAVLVSKIDKVTKTELSQAVSTLRKLNGMGTIANGTKTWKRKYPSDNIPPAPPPTRFDRDLETSRSISI